MAPFDALQPPLSVGEKKIVKAYGGWTQFMISFGLKPYDGEDIDEAKAIAQSFAADDAEEALREAKSRKSSAASHGSNNSAKA